MKKGLLVFVIILLISSLALVLLACGEISQVTDETLLEIGKSDYYKDYKDYLKECKENDKEALSFDNWINEKNKSNENSNGSNGNPEDSVMTREAASFLGMTFTAISEDTVSLTKYDGTLDEIAIPNKISIDSKVFDVVAVGDECFASNDNVTKVTLPGSIKTIGEGAFCDCHFLASVNIPEDITIIQNRTFKNCIALKSITIPAKVTQIGACSTEAPTMEQVVLSRKNLTGVGAFAGCTALEGIAIPKSVKTIGDGAFSDCINLRAVTYEDGLVLDNLGYAVFYASGLIKAEIPNGITKLKGVYYTMTSPVKLTGAYGVFSNCEKLMSITISTNVTEIDQSTFYNCSRLYEVVNLSSLNFVKGSDANGFIAKNAIDIYTTTNYATKLSIVDEYYIYSDGVEKTLLSYAGTDTELTLPSSITIINKMTFAGNEDIASVTMPNSVVAIDVAAFKGCSKLANIVWSTSLQTIADSAFYGVAITSLNLPIGVETIGRLAFASCNSLESASLPSSLEVIGEGAFYSCALNEMTLQNGITEIKDAAFYGCEALTDITYNGTLSEWNAITLGENYSADYLSDKAITIHCSDNNTTTIGGSIIE